MCSCCYARAPPPKADDKYSTRRREFMADGTRIPRTSFACYVCEVRLCADCHHNIYPPHINNGPKPHSIVYTSQVGGSS